MLFSQAMSLTATIVAGTVGLMKRMIRSRDLTPIRLHGDGVKMIAHRGASGSAPENTMVSFEKAVGMKCDTIELDVRMSKDGKLVVMHDATINRTTNGKGEIEKLTWFELQQFDAGNWFDDSFAGEKIPCLEEVLDRFSKRTGMLIELKQPSLYPGIERRLARILERRELVNAEENIIVQSFDHDFLKKLHRILPEIPIGVLICKRKQVTSDNLREFATYANYINPNKRFIDCELANRIHRLGMGVMAWNVQKPKNVFPLLRSGVDGMITNDLNHAF